MTYLGPAMNDPNFPSNLNIRPLHLTPSDNSDVWKQQDAIRQYGIAGRVWEASSALIEYFTSSSSTFTPRCSIFHHSLPTTKFEDESEPPTLGGNRNRNQFNGDHPYDRKGKGKGQSRPKRIIELGSGQSVASLHLASQLQNDDLLVLTDLPNVVPLIQQSVDTWTEDQSRLRHRKPRRAGHVRRDGEAAGEPVKDEDDNEDKEENDAGCKPIAEPMAWGADIGHLEKYGEFTHVVCCDLVYFPNLYPPLLRTLLRLTDPRPDQLPANLSNREKDHQQDEEDGVFGPEVILAYKSRTLALEQSFFDSLALYFRMEPVVPSHPQAQGASKTNTNTTTDTETNANTQTETETEAKAKIYICRRWCVTDNWTVPPEKEIMNGSKDVIRGSSGFGLFEEMLGAIEWD